MVVTAASPLLATADARLGQTIRNEVYTALPLVMNTGGPRDPTAFMFLMPGVQSIGRWGNVMGGQDFTTDMYVEGIPITNAVVQGEGRNLSFGISVDAVDQFQVETSGTAVMFNGQGASNYVVKSGTNTFRGSGFEYFRNKALDAKAFFATDKPDDNQHEYGATLGGPIRRNQMFFFVAYDGYRDRRQTASALVSIPTLAQRNGDFSALPVVDLRSANHSAESRRHRLRARSVPGQRHPAGSDLADLARASSRSCRIRRTPACRTTISAAALPIGFNNENVTGKVDLKLSAAPAGLGPVLARQAQPGDAVSRRHQPADAPCRCRTAETRLVEEIPTSAQVKHTLVLGPRWVNQANVGFSRLSVPIFNATIDGQYPIKAGLRGLPAGRGRFVVSGDFVRRTERAHAVARHRRAGVHRVPEQLHAAGQPELEPRQARDDLRLSGAAHGRQRARAHVRQSRDIRLQQLADGRVQCRPARSRRPPATPMRASCSAS